MKKRFLLLAAMLLTLMGGGKINSLNAQTEPITRDETTITIGDTSTTDGSANYPFCSSYKYTHTQQIYTPTLLKGNHDQFPTGKISKIKYYLDPNQQGSLGYFAGVKVYMRNSLTSSFTSKTAWDKDFSAKDLVFSGSVDVKNGEIEFDLGDKAFTYDPTKNLIIHVEVDQKNGTAAKFKTTASGYNSGLYYRNNNNDAGISNGSWSYASGAANTFVNVITLTFSADAGGGSTAPTDPSFTDTYAYPNGQYATSIFNPSLLFYATNKTHYKVLLSTTQDFSSDVRYIVGDENTWVEDKNEQISTPTIGGLNYDQATTYYWKVIAKNVKDDQESNTVGSTVYSFTTKQISAPGAIEDAYPNGHQDLVNPKFTWTFGSDTEEYQILIDNAVVKDWTNPGSSTTGSYQTSGLSSGEHTWQVNARNSAGTTEGAVYTFSIASLPDNVTPISPADGATDVTSAIVRFRFAPNTTEYRLLYSDTNTDEMIYISVNNGGTGNTWTSTGGVTEMEFTMPYYDSGKTFYWAVDVKNDLGQRSVHGGGEEVAIYSFTTASHFAKNKAPENNEIVTEYPTLKWNYYGGVTQYQILTGTNPNNLTAVTEWLSAEGTGGSYNITANNITNGTKNYWQVNVKDENETEIKGNVWSFDIYLAPQGVQATPEEIFPDNEGNGSTSISWNMMNNVSGYNVYLNGVIQNNSQISSSTNFYTISNLSYNMDPGHSIYVEAVYSNNTPRSNTVNVKVTGLGLFIATVKGYNSDPLENTTITLTCTQDEFEGNANNKVYTFTTNEDGVCSGDIFYGTYNVRVSKDGYNDYTGTITISNNQHSVLDVTLNSNAMYDVIVEDITLDNVTIYLANDELWGESASGDNFVVYVYNANDELVCEGTTYWFSAVGTKNRLVFNWSNWDVFPNGSYKFRVSNVGSSIANMSEIVVKNFDVFEGTENDNRSWYTANNWRSKQVPGDNANVYVLAPLTIQPKENITVETLTILGNDGRKGKIDIYGSLNANNVYNQGGLKLYDGGQLRQNNTNLKGEFVMGIANPTGGWNNSENTTGWQFISSPFTNAPISHFTNNIEGNYDLYKFDGTKADAQWVNQKDENNVEENAFETQFVIGRGYLASYETKTTATLSGTMNAEKSTSWSFSTLYNENNHMAKFHLLGNPFTFDMKLSNFIWYNNVVKGVAIVSSNGGYKYSTVAEDEIATIPVGDGFFIKATGNSPSIIYNEDGGAKRGEIAKSINVIATSKAGNDNVVICFSGEKDGFDKLQNFNREIANIYVENNGSRYGIYNCDENTTEVELSFVASQMGTYSISLDINGDFENVVLVDRLTGIETNMLIEDEYKFVATSKDNAKRFFIRLEDNSQEPTTNSMFVYQSGEELIVNAEGTIQIIDMMGRVVYSSNADNNRIDVSGLNKSAYIVRNINENTVRTQKIVIL